MYQAGQKHTITDTLMHHGETLKYYPAILEGLSVDPAQAGKAYIQAAQAEENGCYLNISQIDKPFHPQAYLSLIKSNESSGNINVSHMGASHT